MNKTYIKSHRHIAFIAPVAAALFFVMLLGVVFSFSQRSAVDGLLQRASVSLSEEYDIAAAKASYEEVLARDSGNEEALYNISRVYYISGDFSNALSAIERYKTLYPKNKRIHYIGGLANGFAGNLDAAAEEFETFIASGLSTWPGYLDLAWVNFQQGDFTAAEKQLTHAINEYGDNVWLNTSLGAVYIAQGEREKAEIVLQKAQAQSEQLTFDEWRKNYSFNDPNKIASEIDDMKATIALNISLASGDGVALAAAAQSINSGFVGISPGGYSHGVVVSACGNSNPPGNPNPPASPPAPACNEIACVSAANVCGQVNTGTQNSCANNNACSATTPPNPSGSCTIATASCGNASGFLGCNGGCNVTAYPVCSAGTQTTTFITTSNNGDFDPSEITANIAVFPALVNPGSTTYVRWVSTETDSCTVTGTNNDSWTGVVGEQLSSAITEQTTYTLSCIAYDGSNITDSATVRIVPVWQEF